MYYPPYNPNPYYNPSPYMVMQREKHDLKRTANALCWTLLLAMLLMSALVILCRVYLSVIGYTTVDSTGDFGGFTPVLYYLATGTGYVAGLAIPVLIYFAAKHTSLSDVLPFQKAGVLKTAACVFFGSAVCMLANIPANTVVDIEKFFGFAGDMPEMPLINDPWVLVLYGITIAVIPPIVEELLFRGMVLQSLRKYGDGFAVMVSAMLFGLYHGNFVQMVFAFIAGLVMALVVLRTGSLWTSILIHFANNSISFALEMTQRFAGDAVANTVNLIVISVLMILGALSLIYILVKDRHFFRGDSSNPMFPFWSRVGAAFANPGGVAMLIFAVGSSVYILMKY
jgi:uncharacterized protein